MFLKNLQISNDLGIIRTIEFHPGLNLIVDETPLQGEMETGNNVGKTSVLILIDFCLGASAKGIYTDPENRKNEYALVKSFLVDTSVLITLRLADDLLDPNSRQLKIERNFLSRSRRIQKIDGEQKTDQEFEETLTNSLFPGHFGKKPTFRQIISHNIRYKDLSVNNTLKTLDAFTRDDEYETLYLFLLGCHFEQGDEKQNLVARIRVETAFKTRLEALQTRSAYETALSLLSEEIATLNARKSTFNVNADFELDLQQLNAVKHRINSITSIVSRLRLRRQLISDATREILEDRSTIDVNQLRSLYEQVSKKIGGVQKSFEELHEFHNRMVDEKARYISQDLPRLDNEIAVEESELRNMLSREATLAGKIARSDSFEGLEALIIDLNEKHRKMGEYETIIQQITDVDSTLKELNESLTRIDNSLFSTEFGETIQIQLNKFNKYFSAISRTLYGERYALKVDLTTNKVGQRMYKFTAFNLNFSSGKKQGEISCFDIAYVQFADNEGIPCYHFLLNDKKELMHDNQLIKISELVEEEDVNVQFVASILKDKLPPELNDDKYFVVKLSQHDKLFRIENGGKPPARPA
ncbi:hypothetical protein AWB69_07692 [Caballeronia udeis]|uniref:DUF2326 domain-containing protein n=1 Tax=Caballeronia udeis TaxID=1232866 RepID=A0A158JEG0_9BURK|nr:hypothetical protein AWB69_07692 [Caballeronia udeis]